jgi:predicted ATP-grasp superfamily ATP-dependent carboligase
VTNNNKPDIEIPDSLDMVIAMDGWIDAGYAAATAAKTLTDVTASEVIYTFDPDTFLDCRERRPRVKIKNGIPTSITWTPPVIKFSSDSAGQCVLLLTGPEPDYRWQEFAGEILKIIERHRVRRLIGLGAFPFAWPHTRQIRVIATGSDIELIDKIGYLNGEIDAPASVTDVIGQRCKDLAGLDFINLWAQVPHYVSNMYYPQAALALLDVLTRLCSLQLDLTQLREEANQLSLQLNNLISASDEHYEMVRNLEEQVDVEDDEFNPSYENLPSGDEIAAELERYLRGETNG